MTAKQMIAQKRAMDSALARGKSYTQAWNAARSGMTQYEKECKESGSREVFDGDSQYQD